MDRVSIYEYDRKNRERVVKAIEEAGGQILSWSFFAKDQSKFELPPGTLSVFIDLSSLFYNEDRADALIAPAELLLNIIQQEQSVALYVIIERQYSKQVRDLLYYKIDEVLNLEDFLEIEKDPIILTQMDCKPICDGGAGTISGSRYIEPDELFF